MLLLVGIVMFMVVVVLMAVLVKVVTVLMVLMLMMLLLMSHLVRRLLATGSLVVPSWECSLVSVVKLWAVCCGALLNILPGLQREREREKDGAPQW